MNTEYDIELWNVVLKFVEFQGMRNYNACCGKCCKLPLEKR